MVDPHTQTGNRHHQAAARRELSALPSAARHEEWRQAVVDIESVPVTCPICAGRLSLLLKPAKGVQVATKTHTCTRDGQQFSTYFRWTHYETGDTHTLSVLTNDEEGRENVSSLTEWRER